MPVYVENNLEDSYSSEVAPEHEEQEPVESEAPEVRRSTRERRPPAWHSEYVTEINVAYCLLTKDGEPSTFHEALESSDITLWMTAMQEEIEAIHRTRHGNLYHYHVEEKPLETNGSTRSSVMAMTKWSGIVQD